MKNAVTIYTGDLKKIKAGKKNVQLTLGAENELRKLLYAKKAVDDMLAYITESLGIVMEAQNVNLIEREFIKVTRTTTGKRFSFDPNKKVNPKYSQTTSYQQPNTKIIDAYLELNKRLPSGILANERKTKVEISLIEE